MILASILPIEKIGMEEVSLVSKKRKIISWSVFLGLIVVLLVLIFVIPGNEKTESIQETMQDAVLHERGLISLFGLINVNPGLISGFLVTIILLVFAVIVRIFFIPKFKYVPGKFQLLIEQAVGFFDNLAVSNSPHHNKFLSCYIFGAGAYIFVGTLFELVGIQVVAVNGVSMALPAPLSDINGAIAIGCFSYLVIMAGGIYANKAKGVLLTLKEFSLPISMSFRLFGALLSGLLVSELVYYYLQLSFILPVIVGVLFTLIHALVQTYVLTMLTALFYGEVSEVKPKKKKEKKVKASI